jgi:hypothetical protein
MKIFLSFTLFAIPLYSLGFPDFNSLSSGPSIDCEEGQVENSPQNIVKSLMNGKLTFMGRDLLPGSDQNRSCVFRNETAYVIYRNCMGSKREAPATSITVIPFNGGSVDFYIENSGRNNGAISSMTRSQYDSTWRVSLANTPPPGNLNMDGVKAYLQASVSMTRGGCFIGSTGEAQNLSSKGACFGGYQNRQWLSDAEAFWREPGSSWGQSLEKLRTHVNNSY